MSKTTDSHPESPPTNTASLGSEETENLESGAVATVDPTAAPSPSLAAELSKLRKELAEKDKKLAKFQEEERRRQEAELSELEKTQQQAQEYKRLAEAHESELVRVKKHAAFLQALQKQGAGERAGLLLKLVNLDDLILEDNVIVGVDDVIAGLRNEAPELFGARVSATLETQVSKPSQRPLDSGSPHFNRMYTRATGVSLSRLERPKLM